MHMLEQFGLYLAETITLVVAIIIVLSAVIGMSSKNKGSKHKLSIKPLNKGFDKLTERIHEKTLDKKQRKAIHKKDKEQKKTEKKTSSTTPSLFVIKFNGDMKASQVKALREEVTAVILAYQPGDEVCVVVTSPGGAVPGYGLAASQLARFRDAGIHLTVAVDQVAASGGYMMAAVANHIIAAPFAIIGSIGVLMQLPNFHRLLNKNNIDYEQITAGKYKRTLTVFGENTDEGRAKTQEDINEVHDLFKQHVKQFRDQVDIDAIATGEYWYGQRALELQLVDTIQTSDDFLLSKQKEFRLFEIEYKLKPSLLSQLTQKSAQLAYQLFSKPLPTAYLD